MPDLSDHLLTGTNNPNKQASVDWGNAIIGALGAVPINVKDYGIVEGDASGANGVANSTAFAALQAHLSANEHNASGISRRGLDPIYFPPGWYEFADHDADGVAIDLTEGTYNITGAGMPKIDVVGDPTCATVLKFPAGVTGIVVQSFDTSGTTTKDGTSHTSGVGTLIQNLAVQGGFSGTEGEHHGIIIRAPAHLRFVQANGFEGDGIQLIGDSRASGGHSGALSGNVDGSTLFACYADENRTGLYLEGADANVCKIDAFSAKNNRAWGIWDSGMLGNVFSMIHTSANGSTSYNDGTTMGATIVTHSGNHYYCIAGQSSGASTNAPSGTTADNTWWAYRAAGSVSATRPAWVSGILVRDGGAYYGDNTAAGTHWDNPYAEGNQAFPQTVGGHHTTQGQMEGLRGTRIRTAADGNVNIKSPATVLSGNIQAPGVASSFGPRTGTAANNAVALDTTSAANQLTFRSWSGGVSQNDGFIKGTRGSGLVVNDRIGPVKIKIGDVDHVEVNSAGLSLVAGKTINFASLTNAADDAAAATASVPVGNVYRNGSQLMVRVA